jgi:DNA-binding NtrC family response regulator
MTTAAMLPPSAGGVLVASPNTSLREQVRSHLQPHCWPVLEVNSGADALVKLESGDWQLLFLDRCLPDLDAEEVMRIIKLRFPATEVKLLDSDIGHLSAFTSLKNPRAGLKPATRGPEPLTTCAVTSAAKAKEATRSVVPLPGMIGASTPMERLYRFARLVAPRSTTVLILGATGTGKELVARAIHELSPRAANAWVVVNCAAIPETLLESELFGYARGAFTGAVQSYAGRIQGAQGGTLFLDEIGDLPLSLQAKLLRFLEQREVQRLGSSDAIKVDVRVVAATNCDLDGQVEAGRFRRDLYYRLSAFPLELAPLAEREGDMRPLTEHFLRVSTASSMPPIVSSEAAGMLGSHSWPGNVRELQQVIERAVILADGADEILPEHLLFSSFVQRPVRQNLPLGGNSERNLSPAGERW